MTQPPVPLTGPQRYEPSELMTRAITRLSFAPSAVSRAVLNRRNDFASLLTAQLTAIALDPRLRDAFDAELALAWRSDEKRVQTLDSITPETEVIIGSGFHAATYASMRVQCGHPRPVVLERGERPGGTFAMTAAPSFHLNSRNRSGPAGIAGDSGVNLNYLPGAPIQTDHLGVVGYQTNADMAFVIRAALAQNARVVPGVAVTGAYPNGGGNVRLDLNVATRERVIAGRVIDARGLGDPYASDALNGTTVLTFPQFMERMVSPWPFKGVSRVAVVGAGDSASCAVEALMGLSPQPPMAIRVLDRVERVDWYAPGLPETCKTFRKGVRARYAPIGRYLRKDDYGVRPLVVIDSRVGVTPLPYGALVDGKTYDMVVMCTGNVVESITGLSGGGFTTWVDESSLGGSAPIPVAMRDTTGPVWRVGPCAQLPFNSIERSNGVSDEQTNLVSMFRTAPKTATLAVQLPALSTLDGDQYDDGPF